jgi:hypothetical protein
MNSNLLVLVGALAIAGCGGPSAQDPMPQTAADYYNEQSRIDCDTEFNCCDAATAQTRSGEPSAAACFDAAAIKNRTDWSSVLAQVDSGKLTFHPDAAAACISALRAQVATCGKLFGVLAADACVGVYTGTLAENDLCPSGYGCGPGLVCFASTYCAKGTAARGADCSSSACQAGLVCLPGNTCGDLLADGATCEHDFQCASDHCQGTCVSSATKTVTQVYCE